MISSTEKSTVNGDLSISKQNSIKISNDLTQVWKKEAFTDSQSTGVIKETPKRYFVLFLFFTLIVVDGFQWICFAGVTNIIAQYYGVNNLAVNSLASINMIMFLLLALPANVIMESIGLRNSILLGSVGTTIGFVAQCYGVHRDRFYVAILSHILMGLVKPFFFSANSKLVSVWFPDHQVGIATAVCVIGDALGTALGFTVPGWLVGADGDDIEQVEWGFTRLLYGLAIVSLADTVLVFIFFDDHPQNAPGLARFKQIEEQIKNDATQAEKGSAKAKMKAHLNEICVFMKNPSFRLICVAFGLNLGTNYAFDILLNQIIVKPHSSSSLSTDDLSIASLPMVGHIGLIILTADILGSLVCGYLLDRYHAYKSISVLMYLLCLVSVAIFGLGLSLSRPAVLYLASLPVGFFITGYSCCGYECAVEASYPNSELISASLLNMSGQVFGVLITFTSSLVIDMHGSVAGCGLLCLFLAIGLLLTCLTSADYRRNQAVAAGAASTQQVDLPVIVPMDLAGSAPASR